MFTSSAPVIKNKMAYKISNLGEYSVILKGLYN